MNPTITIIVPVYNVEAYVRKSLQSIADQTFTDWECIVVDDGSTDGSGAICDEFAAHDPRFRVIHQSNMGLSGARNTGLAVAHGRYIGFLDSDDYIHPDMYQVLLTAIEQTNSEIAVVSTRQVYGLDEPFQPNSPIKYRIMNREQVFHYWFVEPFTSSWMEMVWNKLYKYELIGKESFADVVPAEDREFNTRMCLRCHTVVRVNQVLHHWLIRQNSLSQWGVDSYGIAKHYLTGLESLNICEKHAVAMTEKERGFYFIKLMKQYLLARSVANPYPDVQNKLKTHVARIKSGFFGNWTIPLKYKTVMGLMFYIPWLYDAFIHFNEVKARLFK